MISANFLPFQPFNSNKAQDFPLFIIPKNLKSITHHKAQLITTVKATQIFKILSNSTSKRINSHLQNRNQKTNKDQKIN